MEAHSKESSKTCDTFNMEIFSQIVKGFWILDARQDSEFTSVAGSNLYLKCLTGFWTHLWSNELFSQKIFNLDFRQGSEYASAVYIAITIRRLPIRSVGYLFTKFAKFYLLDTVQ